MENEKTLEVDIVSLGNFSDITKSTWLIPNYCCDT